MKADFTELMASLPLAASARYPHGTPFVQALARGSMRVELFAPAAAQLGVDIQQPHAQDELYVVQARFVRLLARWRGLAGQGGRSCCSCPLANLTVSKISATIL